MRRLAGIDGSRELADVGDAAALCMDHRSEIEKLKSLKDRFARIRYPIPSSRVRRYPDPPGPRRNGNSDGSVRLPS